MTNAKTNTVAVVNNNLSQGETMKTFTTDQELVNLVKNNKGYSFIKFTTTTELKVNKFSRSRNEEIKALKAAGVKKADLPSKLSFDEAFKGKVFVTSHRKGYGMGDYNYESMVQNKRTKEGNTDTFTSEAPRGREFATANRSLLVSTKDDTQYYLRTYKFNKKSTDDSVIHYEDGTPLTDDELKLLKDFTAPKSKATKQGVEDEVIVRDFKVQGIIGVTIGDNFWVREGFENEF